MTHSRPTWDEVWLHAATGIAGRSLCSRAQVGAVIVNIENRIVASGYNGPPSGFQHDDEPCVKWCQRARTAANPHEVTALRRDYSDCPALHAEANALMAADRSTWAHGTIYVLGDVCINCAKLIANSGLTTVVIKPDGKDRSYRAPNKSYTFLEQCGVEVIIHEVESADSRSDIATSDHHHD